MEETITITKCDKCGKVISKDSECKYIHLPIGDLDSHGIWFGNIGKYLWFEDQVFCCEECLFGFITEFLEKNK